MLGEIIRSLLVAEPDIEIVGELADPHSLAEAVEEHRARVLILGTKQGRVPDSCRALVDDRPRLRLLAVSEDARDTTLFELRPYEVALGELSPERLLGAVRSATARR